MASVRAETGRRCAIGCETWPDEMLYQTCPVCGESTRRVSNVSPMDRDEARSILRRALFEAYYERWCLRKGQPVDGPLRSP